MKKLKAFTPSTTLRVFRPSTKLRAFTIVELLVVIVVIGILASITILSYTSITNKAIASSLQSDLTNASKQLDLFKVDHDYYPLTIDCSIPDSDTNKCIRSSNSLNYTPGTGATPSTYVLTATHTSSSTNYTITNNSTPIATAPLNPVADWLAVQTGDHYGNFYDLVSKQYATVTRATSKTIYDPSTNKIYDVPPNSLGIRPRSDGKAGFEAEVEESRTNYLRNSSLELDSDYNGRADSIGGPWGPGVTQYTQQLVTDDPVHGNKYQEFSNIEASSSTVFQIYTSQYYNFSAGETAICSAYVAGDSSGAIFQIRARAYQSSTSLGEVGPSLSLDTEFRKVEAVYTNLPVDTDSVMCLYQFVNLDPGDSPTMKIDAIQLEKGKSSTSYIPTNSSSVTRAADVVTVPTTDWAIDSGSIISLLSLRSWNDGLTHGVIATGNVGTANSVTIDKNAPNQSRMIIYDNNAVYSAPAVSASGVGYKYLIGRWSDSEVSILQEGSSKVLGAGRMPSSHPAEAVLGNRGGYWNDAMHRITIYNKFISDSESINVADGFKDGL